MSNLFGDLMNIGKTMITTPTGAIVPLNTTATASNTTVVPPLLTDIMRRAGSGIAAEPWKYGDAASQAFTPVEGPQAMVGPIPSECAECGLTMHVHRVDEIRIRFDHAWHSSCSRSGTTFMRPIALFIRQI